MDSNRELTNWGQDFLAWSGKFSLITPAFSGIGSLTKFIPFLANHQKNPILTYFQEIPWECNAVLVCCGVFLWKIPFWIRVGQKTISFIKNLGAVSKTEDLHVRVKLLQAIKKASDLRAQLRKNGVAIPGESEDDGTIAKDFLKSIWADPDQLTTRRKFPLYLHLVITAIKFLKISEKELAMRLHACGVPLPEKYVGFLMRHPEFILHRKHWPALCVSLFAHENYIETRRRFHYHKKWIVLRIKRMDMVKTAELSGYSLLGIKANLSNLSDINGTQLRKIITVVEEELARDENLIIDERIEL
jgi:hypothetical protein